MNIAIELVFLSILLVQLSLMVIFLLLFTKQKVNGLAEVKDKYQKDESVQDSFKINCKKYFLTAREMEILKLISDGLPYKLIASQLCISEYTVSTHIKNMFTKVDVTNKMELVSRISTN